MLEHLPLYFPLSFFKLFGLIFSTIKQLHFLPFLFLFIHHSPPIVRSQIEKTLLSFKAVINDDLPNVLVSWNITTNYCAWSSIICIDDTCTSVIFLNLSGRSLYRTISSEIGMLERLWVLSIPSNRLFAPIPQSLSLLSNLKFLDFSNNNLGGKIFNCSLFSQT